MLSKVDLEPVAALIVKRGRGRPPKITLETAKQVAPLIAKGMSEEQACISVRIDSTPPCQGDPIGTIQCKSDIVTRNDPGSCFATVPVVPAVAELKCSQFVSTMVNAIGIRDDDPGKPLSAPYPVGT